ncbi:hypothetical protein Pcinc_018560 [Petrolisthes cinctipes]|uniref:Transposase n=2 Tax=Petrolisthes cinctipes TaxID=88211 RepID=A0AAE1KIX9_PETCI|nr:hypothetical protein Pcinc_018560 [Petrolisthes cinctipes]
MDVSVLKTLLASQEQAYRGALEVYIGQTNDMIKALQSTIKEVTQSLEFTQQEVDQLKQQVVKLEAEKTENKEVANGMKEDLQASKKLVMELEERCNHQEDHSRRNNLQIVGMEERPEGETWEQTAVLVSKLLEDKLELPNLQMERARRVGQRSNQLTRPIIARFVRFCDREAVMRSVTKLRGTRIFINEDLCPASQSIRKAQLPLLKKARSEGKLAYFRHTKLVIKQRMSAPQHEVPTRTFHSSRPSSLNPPPPGGRDSGSEAWPQLSVSGAVSSVDSAVGVSGSPAGVTAVVAAPDVTATLGAVGGGDVAVSPSLKAGVCSGEKKDVPPLSTVKRVNTRMSSRPSKK